MQTTRSPAKATISVSVGMLMAGQMITQGQAFAMLVTASRGLNRKVRDIAAYVSSTGDIPTAHAHVTRVTDNE